jgi:ComF family protein
MVCAMAGGPGRPGGFAASVRATAARVLDLALPPTCAGCGVEGEVLCPGCLPALRQRLDRPAGVPIGLPSDVPAPLVQLEWCAAFDGPVRGALHALKYAGEQRLADPLGEAIAARWRRAGAGGDFIVHVPVHADRARERGYDQAERIAMVAGRALGLPVVPVLERWRATVAQYELVREARAANVGGAFRLSPGIPAGALEGRWPVLVDDVVTTGSTLVDCARVLLEAGVVAVSAVTVARER